MKTDSRLLSFRKVLVIVFLFLFSAVLTQAQTTSFASMSSSPAAGSGTNWILGGRIGMVIGSGFGGSTVGLAIGPMAEVLFSRNMAVGTELNINTFGGTPIEWADYFKYYFDVPGSTIKPYANAGLSLWFATDGPYFAIRFGGGANFKVANNLYIPADLQLGPVFYSTKTADYFGNSTSSTKTIFYIGITTGIRYELP